MTTCLIPKKKKNTECTELNPHWHGCGLSVGVDVALVYLWLWPECDLGVSVGVPCRGVAWMWV